MILVANAAVLVLQEKDLLGGKADTAPDVGAYPAGSGWVGDGPPLSVGAGSRAWWLHDGNGLCTRAEAAPPRTWSFC